MFSLENCCYLKKYIIYSGSCQKNCIGLQASAPTEQTLSLYCLNPPLLDSLLQRKLSRWAGMAWLKKDVFVFKLTEYFNAAFFQVVSVSELWAGAIDLKTCGFTISSLLVVHLIHLHGIFQSLPTDPSVYSSTQHPKKGG